MKNIWPRTSMRWMSGYDQSPRTERVKSLAEAWRHLGLTWPVNGMQFPGRLCIVLCAWPLVGKSRMSLLLGLG